MADEDSVYFCVEMAALEQLGTFATLRLLARTYCTVSVADRDPLAHGLAVFITHPASLDDNTRELWRQAGAPIVDESRPGNPYSIARRARRKLEAAEG